MRWGWDRHWAWLILEKAFSDLDFFPKVFCAVTALGPGLPRSCLGLELIMLIILISTSVQIKVQNP